MCEQKPRFWFSACSRSGGRMVHVISARSIGRVRAFYGRLFDEYVIEQLKWSDLFRLLGVTPPMVNRGDTFAEGPIVIPWQGKTISIEVAD